ncbi:MAG: AAA family ATPase [Candidatus Zapsychrus exili]|nr:AAA family ATPase [Candidatus Zapsychrus exili]
MYLRKLEIFGFKSFADKTVLNFESGITAVVGPNGCGKSNVFDAIRWVLGEQSIKELRASAREDVIFSGTDKRPPVNLAEVSLHFSNKTGAFDIDEKEVIITRRLHRSGESEYLLNKKTARLKDIQQLLMGTGIGAEAYSMIQQGKVDLVVSAKPEERRMIFDEASGITRYKAKKREALNKLKDTENNLLRINDIAVEVKRQIGSIERQANKARKYKGEFEKLKTLELRVAKNQLGGIQRQKSTLGERLSSIREKESQFDLGIDEVSETLTNEINHLGEIDEKIGDIRSEDIKLESQIDLNSRQIGFNEERIDNLIKNAEKLEEQKEQLIERCKNQQTKIEELRQDTIFLNEKILEDESVLFNKRDNLSRIERAIESERSRIKETEERIFVLTSKQVNLRNELTDVIKEMQGALARKKRLEIENQKVLDEKRDINEKFESVEGQINGLKIVVGELDLEKENKGSQIDGLREDLARVEESIDTLDKKKLFLKSQKEFIEKLHVQYQDMPDPVVEGRFITQAPPLEHHTGIIGKVKEVLPLSSEKFETLKKSLSYRVEEISNLSGLFEVICETKFIELDPQNISSQMEEIEREIVQLLSQAENLKARIEDEMNILRRIIEDLQNKEKDYSILESQKIDVLEEINKLSGELELVDSETEEVRELLSSTRKKEEEINYQLDTVNQDIGSGQNAIKGGQESINQKMKEKEDVTVSIAQLETELNSQRDKLRVNQDNETTFSESLDSWLEEIKKIEDEYSGYGAKNEEYRREIEKLSVENEEVKIKKDSLRVVLSEQEIQKEEVGRSINNSRSRMKELETKLDELKQERHGQELNEQEFSFKSQSIKDRLVQTYKMDFDEALEKAKQQRLEREESERQVALDVLQEAKGEESQEEVAAQDKQLKEVSDAELGPEYGPHLRPLEGPQLESQGELQEETQAPVKKEEVFNCEFLLEEDDIDIEEASNGLIKLKKRCDSYGSVNLVAIEEYEELKERFEFLTKQQSDLIEAKSQLMSTINKINRSTRRMFMDTFTKVGEEFRIYFRMLFGGGEAQLVLLDPDNVLESGIDIVARPPGKKPQSISLLSGGEKTLTAIALIFGVFKVNPSPFCVLDEIDAALDEANVDRFSYLLKDFAKIAQFIVITHNKKTIAISDVMYGITMPETGISRIVSVKFSEDKKQGKKEEVAVGV